MSSQRNLPKQKTGANIGPRSKIKTWYKLKDIETFGDPLVSKNSDSFRILFENADGLPSIEKSRYHWKYKRLKRIIHSLDCDVTGLVETKLTGISLLQNKKWSIK